MVVKVVQFDPGAPVGFDTVMVWVRVPAVFVGNAVTPDGRTKKDVEVEVVLVRLLMMMNSTACDTVVVALPCQNSVQPKTSALRDM